MSTAMEMSPVCGDATYIRPQHSKAIDAKALASHGDKSPNSDDDSGLSDSNLSPSSDNNGYSSEDELGCLCMSNHSRWSDLDKQRLLAYVTGRH